MRSASGTSVPHLETRARKVDTSPVSSPALKTAEEARATPQGHVQYVPGLAIANRPSRASLRLMRAIQAQRAGGPKGIELVDPPDQRPGRSEVPVRTAAAGINFHRQPPPRQHVSHAISPTFRAGRAYCQRQRSASLRERSNPSPSFPRLSLPQRVAAFRHRDGAERDWSLTHREPGPQGRTPTVSACFSPTARRLEYPCDHHSPPPARRRSYPTRRGAAEAVHLDLLQDLTALLTNLAV